MKNFRDALRQNEFVLTADLALQATTSVADIEAALGELAPIVDAVQVIDDRDAIGHMAPLAAAAIVLGNDMDAVVHLTSRDRNRIALQAELLGAAALGLTSLVIQRGEKLSRKGALRGKGVFDTKETRLTEMARRISDESKLVSEPGFLLGAYVTVFSPGDDWQAARLLESVEAGTRLLITQPCLNAALLERYMAKVVDRKILHRASLLVEVPLLCSADEARKYKANNPSALVPDDMIAKIVGADDPRAEGISACAGMLTRLRSISGVAGANIRHGGDVRGVVAAARLSGFTGS